MSTLTAQRAPTRSSAIHIVTAFSGFIVIGLFSGMLGLAWTPMRAEFAQPLDTLGLILLASTLGYLTSSFLCGSITARVGIGWTTLIGGILLSSALAVVGLLQVFWLIIPVYIVGGVGNGLIDAGLNAYVAEHHSKRTLNWLHACFGVGTTIAPILFASLINREISWRVGFGLVAAFCALITLGFLFMRGRWSVMAAQTTRAADGVGIRLADSVRIPAVWLGVLLFFVYAGLESSPGTWMYPLYNEARGISAATAGFWVSLYWGSFTIGRIFFGAIINYFPIKTLMRVCLFFTLVGAVLVWWTPLRDLWIFSPVMGDILRPMQVYAVPFREIGFVGLALLGFAQAPMFPVFISQTPARVGARHAPNAIGFQVAGAGIGVAVVPALMGFFARRTSLEIVPPTLVVVAIAVIIIYEISLRAARGTDAV